MTRLSVNINKFATLRNARGNNLPDIVKAAKDCERFGAEGITVHPRPDERHIRYEDVLMLKEVVNTEFNIEGFPDHRFMDLVLQVTLVPDSKNQLTSNHGWDTLSNASFLSEKIIALQSSGIRVSLFIDPVAPFIEGAGKVGTDRIEFYTGPYAAAFPINKEKAISDYVIAAKFATSLGLGINAGHDLNLSNLRYFNQQVTDLMEVSIGHAIICDAIYLGLENTIQLYLRALNT